MAGANTLTFTDAGWDKEVLNSDAPVLVDFWAEWCGPCRMMTPTIDAIAEAYAGRVKVGKLNVDENGATIQYQLSGAVINRTTGGVTTPLIGGVQTFALTYFSAYDGSTNTGTTTGVAGSVTLVRLQLVTGTEQSVATYSAANQHATVEMLVRLRNM